MSVRPCPVEGAWAMKLTGAACKNLEDLSRRLRDRLGRSGAAASASGDLLVVYSRDDSLEVHFSDQPIVCLVLSFPAHNEWESGFIPLLSGDGKPI